jgi:hypothetical protein
MPYELPLLALLFFGCQQDGTKPVTALATQDRHEVAQRSKPKGPKWDPAKKLPAGKGLYKDADVLKLTQGKRFEDGAVTLDVVPDGESGYPREDVYKALGIEESRLKDKRIAGGGFVVYRIWQLSPSYDIMYGIAMNDKSQRDVDVDSPKRKIGGVTILRREE